MLEWERDGVVELRGCFGADAAARMQDVVWGELRQRHGILRDDPSTWAPQYPTGLKNAKRHRAFDAILTPPLAAVLDDLLGPGRWAPPKQWGNVLVTMPTPEPWRVPWRIWHADFQYPERPWDRPAAVKVWALLDDIGPGGGGTPQLLGSHRATAAYLAGRTGDEREYKRVRDGFLRSDPWLRRLIDRADDDPARTERCLAGARVGDVDLRVVELTGRAGDVFVIHPWVMHTIATCAADRPRLMRSAGVARSSTPDSREPTATARG